MVWSLSESNIGVLSQSFGSLVDSSDGLKIQSQNPNPTATGAVLPQQQITGDRTLPAAQPSAKARVNQTSQLPAETLQAVASRNQNKAFQSQYSMTINLNSTCTRRSSAPGHRRQDEPVPGEQGARNWGQTQPESARGHACGNSLTHMLNSGQQAGPGSEALRSKNDRR